MCTKYPCQICVLQEAGHYVKSQCEDLLDAHLHHREGGFTVSKDHKFMDKDIKFHSCFHADLAKKEEEMAAEHIAVDKPTYHAELAKTKEEMTAVHIAVDKYAIQAKLARKGRKWLQKWLQCTEK